MPLLGFDFVRRYVWPDVRPMPISDTLRMAEAAGFGVCDVEKSNIPMRTHCAIGFVALKYPQTKPSGSLAR
jgi:hypothetical protein